MYHQSLSFDYGPQWKLESGLARYLGPQGYRIEGVRDSRFFTVYLWLLEICFSDMTAKYLDQERMLESTGRKAPGRSEFGEEKELGTRC